MVIKILESLEICCVSFHLATLRHSDMFQQGQRSGLFPAVYSKTDVIEARISCPKNVPLDENHSHFVLIDDGSENKFGAEIDFRTRLEKFISEQHVDPENKESCKEEFFYPYKFCSGKTLC